MDRHRDGLANAQQYKQGDLKELTYVIQNAGGILVLHPSWGAFESVRQLVLRGYGSTCNFISLYQNGADCW